MIWKLCRITDLHTARLAADLGVNFLGLHAIYELKTSRSRVFKRISQELMDFYPGTKPVLVTKITNITLLVKLVKQCDVKILQLHIPIPPADLIRVKSKLVFSIGPSVEIIPVLASTDTQVLQRAQSMAKMAHLFKYLILDSSWRGGSGIESPYKTTLAVLHFFRSNNILLAGGIDCENVREFFSRLKPAGVDVQSKLELNQNGRPKDPIKLFKFCRLVGRRRREYYFRHPPRPQVSLAITQKHAHNFDGICKRFCRTDIDLIHFDHSDGSLAPSFRSEPIDCARILQRLAPCLRYDLHLFVENTERWGDIIDQYLKVNPLLRILYFHFGSGMADPVYQFMRAAAQTQAHRIGFGMAIHAPKFNVITISQLLKSAEKFPIEAISLVSHSKRHSLALSAKNDVELMETIINWKKRKHLNLDIGIDRDMSVKKLKLFAHQPLNSVIVGSRLIASNHPQPLISQLRSLLTTPTF